MFYNSNCGSCGMSRNSGGQRNNPLCSTNQPQITYNIPALTSEEFCDCDPNQTLLLEVAEDIMDIATKYINGRNNEHMDELITEIDFYIKLKAKLNACD